MADKARGPQNDNSGPPLNDQTLAARCPGFSNDSYFLGDQRRLHPDPEVGSM